MPCAQNKIVLLTPLLLPFLVRSTILLTVEGDAFLDVYKPVSWSRSASDPETFLLVNVVLDKDATHGTQALLRTNGSMSGTNQVVARFPGTHHVIVFLNASGVTENAVPIATSNNFGVNAAPTSFTKSSTIIGTGSPGSTTIMTVPTSPTVKAVSHSNTPALAGGIVAAVIGVVLITVGIWLLLRRRHKKTTAIITNTVTQPFTLQAPPNHASDQAVPFRTEKSSVRPLLTLIGTQRISKPTFHQPVLSSRSQGVSTSPPTIAVETSHYQASSFPGKTVPPIPPAPQNEAGRMENRLDEAVIEIANLRGELESLRTSAWPPHPMLDIPPPSYDDD